MRNLVNWESRLNKVHDELGKVGKSKPCRYCGGTGRIGTGDGDSCACDACGGSGKVYEY